MSRMDQQFQVYMTMLCHRQDVYARQRQDGGYFVIRKAVTPKVILCHIRGAYTCGWYVLGEDNSVHWVVLDADGNDGLCKLQAVWRDLCDLGLASYLETSRRGGHLWLFLAEPVQARVVRSLMQQVLAQRDIDDVEIYPRQDELVADGVGNLVRGPLGVHQMSGKRYPFVCPETLEPVGEVMSEQLAYLVNCRRNTVHQIADALALVYQRSRMPESEPAAYEQEGGPIGKDSIQHLKEAIGDMYMFISQYVDLDEQGRGSCPFHPPDVHPSFSVNRKEGYWVCFHETNPATGRYRGGDAIEFYRQLKGFTFKEAVRSLAVAYNVPELLA